MEDRKRRLAVFCSSSDGIDPKYSQAARTVVQAACLRGYAIVSGGSFKGTMGVVTDAVREAGGTHVGVIPRFMEQYASPLVDELIWTDTMSERKSLMIDRSWGVVALPGGPGTMDELFEAFVLRKLGRYDGRIFVLDLDGFYAPLRELLARFVETGMATAADIALVEFCSTPEELIERL